jgi:excisionase family DNA binding protein
MAKPTTGRAAEQAHTTGPLAVGIPQALELTSLSRSRLYGEIREGRLKVKKSGRRTLIPVAELHRWLAALPAA